MNPISDLLSQISIQINGPPLWDIHHPPPELNEYRQDPKLFLSSVLDAKHWWSGQEEICKSVIKHDRLAIASGHALGKDWLSARLILWFLYCFEPSIVIATSASDRQVSAIIWGELSEAFSHARYKLPGHFITKKLVIDETRKWYAMGFATKEIRNQPGKMQGYHQKNTMILFSEAQAIERPIWEQSESLMTGSFVKWVAIGNPIINYGPFYEACQSTSEWHSIRLDCEKTPNVITGRDIIPGMVTKRWVDDMAKKYGKNHPTYKAKVNGIAPARSVDAFIETDWLEYANGTGMSNSRMNGVKVAGVDIASIGGDKTVITKRDGMRVISVEKYSGRNTMETVGKIVGLFKEGYYRVYLDVTGIGTGVYDRLVELGFHDKAIPVNFGGKPIDDQDPRSGIKNTEKFADYSTQMYDNLAELMQRMEIGFPFDEELNSQLLNRRMKILSNGKKKIEPKDDYKSRGFDSPDEADALALCFCNAQPRNYSPPAQYFYDEDEELSKIFS